MRGVLITPVEHSGPDRLRDDARPRASPSCSSTGARRRPQRAGAASRWTTSRAGTSPSRHLLELGHTRIGFVGGPRLDRAGRPTAAAERCAPYGPRGRRSRRRSCVLETSALTLAEGRQAGQRVVGMPARRRPTAVFCANDLLAIGFLQQMIQHGVDVPGDMAIVGYDDIEFAAAAAVPLSSVRQPRYELGRRGVRAAARGGRRPRRRAAAAAHVHQQVEFTPELVVRASSGRRAARRGA